ncbi:MAG TPA: SDR family NAD(P)-dependent oxidoreductase [Alphaproteobacteria bacterium]|nr:SDR family NAD(P)-dependent oxidoreductase [Alphaproteobacteria bacterium]
MSGFAGQSVLVTGAGRGIGKAIALRFARAGADVGVVDRNGAWAEATAGEIAAVGRRSWCGAADVGDHDQVQSFMEGAIESLGKVDVLVNNAGTSGARPFLEITKDDWEAQLRVHLSGTFYCAQAAARDMRKRSYGRIVCIASVAGLMGPIDLAAYGAAKAGIIGLVRAMSLELADFGITANAVAPGPIDTELLRSSWPADVYAERAEHIPLRRLGQTEEIAHAVEFLASREAAYVSGVVIPVDGGSVAAGAYMVEKYRRRKAGK